MLILIPSHSHNTQYFIVLRLLVAATLSFYVLYIYVNTYNFYFYLLQKQYRIVSSRSFFHNSFIVVSSWDAYYNNFAGYEPKFEDQQKISQIEDRRYHNSFLTIIIGT